jgi:hypothetical protein
VNIYRLGISVLIFGAVIVTGCTGSTPVVRTSTLTPEPLPKECHLDIYISEADITRHYETVCLIYAESGCTLLERHRVDAAFDRIRSKACACGAHALITTDVAEPGAFSSWVSGSGKRV